MSLPNSFEFLTPFVLALSLLGFMALVAKCAVYCLFQGTGKGVLLAVVVHGLSWITGLVVALAVALLLQTTSIQPLVVASFLCAATISVVIEFACLFPLRKKLALRWIGMNVVVANAVYYAGLVLVVPVTKLLIRFGIF